MYSNLNDRFSQTKFTDSLDPSSRVVSCRNFPHSRLCVTVSNEYANLGPPPSVLKKASLARANTPANAAPQSSPKDPQPRRKPATMTTLEERRYVNPRQNAPRQTPPPSSGPKRIHETKVRSPDTNGTRQRHTSGGRGSQKKQFVAFTDRLPSDAWFSPPHIRGRLPQRRMMKAGGNHYTGRTEHIRDFQIRKPPHNHSSHYQRFSLYDHTYAPRGIKMLSPSRGSRFAYTTYPAFPTASRRMNTDQYPPSNNMQSFNKRPVSYPVVVNGNRPSPNRFFTNFSIPRRGRGRSRQKQPSWWQHDRRLPASASTQHNSLGVPPNASFPADAPSTDEYIDDFTPEDLAQYKLEIDMDDLDIGDGSLSARGAALLSDSSTVLHTYLPIDSDSFYLVPAFQFWNDSGAGLIQRPHHTSLVHVDSADISKDHTQLRRIKSWPCLDAEDQNETDDDASEEEAGLAQNIFSDHSPLLRIHSCPNFSKPIINTTLRSIGSSPACFFNSVDESPDDIGTKIAQFKVLLNRNKPS